MKGLLLASVAASILASTLVVASTIKLTGRQFHTGLMQDPTINFALTGGDADIAAALPAASDHVVVVATSRGQVSQLGATGYEPLVQDTVQGVNLFVGIKRMGSTPDTSVKITTSSFSNFATSMAVSIYVFRGVHRYTWNEDVTPTLRAEQDNTLARTIEFNPITMGGAGRLVMGVGVFGYNSAGGPTFVIPGGDFPETAQVIAGAGDTNDIALGVGLRRGLANAANFAPAAWGSGAGGMNNGGIANRSLLLTLIPDDPATYPVGWTVDSIFAGGKSGFRISAAQSAKFQDEAGTVPVTAPGQRVRRIHSTVNGHVFTTAGGSNAPFYSIIPAEGIRQLLLAGSNDFLHGRWARNNVNILPNDTPDHEGGNNGHRITGANGNAPHNITQTFAMVSGRTYTMWGLFKAGNTPRVLLGMYDGNYRDHIFDMSSGTWVLTVAGTTLHQTNLGGGWWLLGITRTATATGYSPFGFWFGPINANGTVWNNVTSGNFIYARKAMVNVGSSPAAYQDVGEYGVYPIPTTGYPALLFLRTAGVSVQTWLRSTGTIDFSADKIRVWAALHNPTPWNAGYGFIVSNQSNPYGNGNNFALLNGDGSWGDVNMAMRGNSVNNTNGYRGSREAGGNRRMVITARADLDTGFSSFRVNGARTDFGTVSMGSGGFGNKQVDIGREYAGSNNGEFFVTELVARGTDLLDSLNRRLVEDALATSIGITI